MQKKKSRQGRENNLLPEIDNKQYKKTLRKIRSSQCTKTDNQAKRFTLCRKKWGRYPCLRVAPCNSKGNKRVIFICQNNSSWHGSNCTCWPNNTNKGGVLWQYSLPAYCGSQFELSPNYIHLALSAAIDGMSASLSSKPHCYTKCCFPACKQNQGPLAHLCGRWIHQMICSASSHQIQHPLWNSHYGVHVPYLTKTVQNFWFWFLRHLLRWCSSYHRSQRVLMQNCMCLFVKSHQCSVVVYAQCIYVFADFRSKFLSGTCILWKLTISGLSCVIPSSCDVVYKVKFMKSCDSCDE